MPRKVNIPGVGTVNFPDDMPFDQIASEAARLSGQQKQPSNTSQIDATRALGSFAPTIPAPPNALEGAVANDAITPLSAIGRPVVTMASQVGDLAKGAVNAIPGVGLYQDVKNAMQHLSGTAPPEPPFMDKLAGAAGINRRDLAQAALQRDIPQMVGETAVPLAQAVLLGKGIEEMRNPAGVIYARKVTPKQTEAATATFEPPTGKAIDPYEEVAKPALPELRNEAAKMGVDPDKAFKGREGNQLGIKIADEAIKTHDAEMAQITKPYANQVVSMSPIADAIRAEITPEMRANEPKLVANIESEAAKFDRDGTLGEVNQYRMRKNKELSSFYNKTIQGQVTSPLQVQAEEAGLNAARSVQYGKLADLSKIPEDYIRNLQKREGALISYRNGIEKMANKISPQQAEAVSKTVRERLVGVRPSRYGMEHSFIQNVFGLNPVDVMNARLRSAFSDLGAHEPPPNYNMQPPAIRGLLPAGNVSAPLPMGARQMTSVPGPPLSSIKGAAEFPPVSARPIDFKPTANMGMGRPITVQDALDGVVGTDGALNNWLGSSGGGVGGNAVRHAAGEILAGKAESPLAKSLLQRMNARGEGEITLYRGGAGPVDVASSWTSDSKKAADFGPVTQAKVPRKWIAATPEELKSKESEYLVIARGGAPTGAQMNQGALLNAQGRPITVAGEPVPGSDSITSGINAARARREVGSVASTVPSRMMPQNPIVSQIGTQAAAIPDSVLGPKSEPSMQYLSGSAHPEMSGELRQPGTLLVDNPQVAERALARYRAYTKRAEYRSLDAESRAQVDAMAAELERVAALGRAGKGTYSPGKLNQTFFKTPPPTPPSGSGALNVAIGSLRGQ